MLVPGTGFESVIWPTLFGAVNPVFSFTLSELSRVLSQAELPRRSWAPNSDASLNKLRLLPASKSAFIGSECLSTQSAISAHPLVEFVTLSVLLFDLIGELQLFDAYLTSCWVLIVD